VGSSRDKPTVNSHCELTVATNFDFSDKLRVGDERQRCR
jgi:hypothetical protein